MIIHGVHDHYLVLLSIIIAVFASFTALNLAGRARASFGWMRQTWLAAAALSLGGGIWAMHFVAMLAFSMPGMETSYDVGLTLLSLAVAVAFTGAGFTVVSLKAVSLARIVTAGLLMGFGVLAMHYMGMAAMRMDATLGYERSWLAISALIAIGAATGAVWLASRDQKTSHRAAASVVMGIAIAGMHFAGMRAAMFTADPHVSQAADSATVGQTYLAVAISVFTFFILLMALGAAALERLFSSYAGREARIALRLRIADVLRGEETDDALPQIAALIGEYFSTSRTGFAQLDPVADLFDYEVCWTDGTVPPLLGRFPAAAFGVKIVAELSAGRTVVIDDLLRAELSDEIETKDTAREVDTRAILVVPFVRGGQLRTIVYLNDRHRRDWHAKDVEFMEELAERVRLVIDRKAAQDQLRELNASLEARIEARTQELQRAQAAQRQADALYRAYFENTPDPLFVVKVERNGDFVIEEINPAHEMEVGFSIDEIRGRRVEESLPDEVARRVLETYRHVVATRTIYQYQEVFRLPDGPRHWDTTLVPLLDVTGQVERIIGASRNVTRQVVAEEALRQSQKMEAMGQLTGGVAHDFNNLLTPILGSLDRLQSKGVGDERDRRLIDAALASAERARTLVQRLLSFARRQPLKPVPVDVSALVDGMRELLSSTIGPQIKIEVEAAAGLPAATADANQLEMALLNLSVNARDAMPNGGVLRISVSREFLDGTEPLGLAPGGYTRLCVTDNGIGMSEETRKRAVEPFFSTKGVGRGTGLGLSMVHGLAGQLAGAMTIDSQPGEGTSICLWLPESTRIAADTPVRVEPIAVAGGQSAILVDDETLVRDSAAQMLTDLGYRVSTASSANEALGLIADGVSPELLITDHLMPGMTGTELANQVLRQAPDTKVLIISGYADAGDIDPDLPLLAKPFRQADLAAMLKKLSETRRGSSSASAEM